MQITEVWLRRPSFPLISYSFSYMTHILEVFYPLGPPSFISSVISVVTLIEEKGESALDGHFGTIPCSSSPGYGLQFMV